MVQSHKKSARVILVAVLVSFSIVLFQNCGKKDGTVSVVGSPSTGTDPNGTSSDSIELSIRTASGLNAPLALGDLDPEANYYFQAQNIDLNGFACAEVDGVNTGACLSGSGSSLPINTNTWKELGASTIEQQTRLGDFAFGETVHAYFKQGLQDQPVSMTYRVKSFSELLKPSSVSIWYSSDVEGRNRIRSIGVGSNKNLYSHAVNISADGINAELCQDLWINSMAPNSPCVDSMGNKKASGPWVTKALYPQSSGGFFQSTMKTASGAGSVVRYYNADPVDGWLPTTATCLKNYINKGGVVSVFPLNLNGGTCP